MVDDLHNPPSPPHDADAFQLALYYLTISPRYVAGVFLLCCGIWGMAAILRISKVRKWNTFWVLFFFGSLVPVFAYLLPWKVFGELTSMQWPRLLAVCLCCSLAQAVFGWQAWLLRRHGATRAWEGMRSGLIFFAVTYPTIAGYVMLIPLFGTNSNVQEAINGEVWALLGAAQLIVALTNGIAERRAFEREVRLQTVLDQLTMSEKRPVAQRK